MEKLIITPKTKIYDLLEAYPELEETLLTAAPEFNKLRNPVLRRTITRITSISQAATIGGIPVEDLVNKLRQKAGQGTLDQMESMVHVYVTTCPDWYKNEAVIGTLDIRDMLNRGEQPVHEVLAALKRLNKKEILEVIAPFIPAPLLDKSLGLGYKHWLDRKSEQDLRVYFTP
jgi:hypothetical protein